MREFALPLAAVSTESSREVSSVQNKRQRWLAALLASSLSGIFVGIAGLIISGLSLINIAVKPDALSQIGTWMIVGAFPLLMISAHALDKIEQLKKAEKQKRYSC